MHHESYQSLALNFVVAQGTFKNLYSSFKKIQQTQARNVSIVIKAFSVATDTSVGCCSILWHVHSVL